MGRKGFFKMRFLKILGVENGLIVMSAERLIKENTERKNEKKSIKLNPHMRLGSEI